MYVLFDDEVDDVGIVNESLCDVDVERLFG